MNNAARNSTTPTTNANTVASLSHAAAALHAEWDAAYETLVERKADMVGKPLIEASASLVSLVTARRAVTGEDYRAKAALALLWCRGREGEDEGLDLILSLARDVLDLDRH